VLPVLSCFYEEHSQRQNLFSLMCTFLGCRKGEVVLDGQMKSGHGEDNHAVIWICDLRDSTLIFDSMSR
jgi:hypothetical protein